MGLLKDEAIRLLREKWPNASMLAEELFAILNSDLPTGIDGPLTIDNQSPDQPALIIRQFGDSPIDIVVQRPGQPGGLPSEEDQETVSPAEPTTTTTISGGGGAAPGQGVSGTGAVYQVALYEQGLAQDSTRTVTVTQLQIDAGDTIPAGTWVIVFGAGDGTFFMQCPVWL